MAENLGAISWRQQCGSPGPPDAREPGMIGQQMQDPYEPPCVHHGGRVLFQFSAELKKVGGQPLVSVHR
jgi:hypothetical protein